MIPNLVQLLDQPDPSDPQALPNGRVVVKEVVRVNHLTNCLMCHPPSYDGGGPALGVDPVLNLARIIPLTAVPVFQQGVTAIEQRLYNPTPRVPTAEQTALRQPLAAPSSGACNYTNRSLAFTTKPPSAPTRPAAPVTTRPQIPNTMPGVRRGPAPAPVQPVIPLAEVSIPLVVRGDITFFRQDFSVKIPIGPGAADLFPSDLPAPLGYPAGPGGAAPATPATPAVVRYDYLVRTRLLTPAEAARWKEGHYRERPDYAQRQAVLFTLRELTGQDAGTSTAAWQALFPRYAIDLEAADLRRQLTESANAVASAILVRQWSDQSGELRTAALASLVPSFRGEFQQKLREAVVARLTRLDAEKLRRRLSDEDDELRRAAIAACGRKKDKTFVPDLIAALADADPADGTVIEDALRSLTREKFDGAADW